MISFRQHVVSLLAVFLALAVGVVLGGGPLSEVGRADPGDDRSAASVPDPAAGYAESFSAALAPGLVAGRLAERGVVVLALPGASEEHVGALEQQVAAAGGTVTARLTAEAPLTSGADTSLVDTLGSQLMTQLAEEDGPDAEPAVDPASTTYDRIGELLGLAIATTAPEGAKAEGRTQAILQGMSGAGLVTASDEPDRRAPLVLVVLGSEPETEGGDAVVPALLTGMAREASGVVVAGTLADGTGQLAGVRAAPVAASVATVDGVDTVPGQVATVLALARALGADGGSFGATGADGPLPLG